MPRGYYKNSGLPIAKGKHWKLKDISACYLFQKGHKGYWLGKKRLDMIGNKWGLGNHSGGRPKGFKITEKTRNKMIEAKRKMYGSLEKKTKIITKMTETRKLKPWNAQLINYERIEKEIPKLEKQGFRCIPIGKVIPDIVAIKDNKLYAIEIEYGNNKIRYDKYDKIKYKYDDVIWILRKK